MDPRVLLKLKRISLAGLLAMQALWPTVVVFAGVPTGSYDPNSRTLMPNQTPPELRNVGITEHLGTMLDLDLKFTDEAGQVVQLKDFYHRGRPVILSLVYYSCPHLCNFHLNGLTDVFRSMKWTLGDQFEAIAVTIDPHEKPDLALAKKNSHLKVYGRPEGAAGWHFLTGSDDQIKKLAEQVGFKYYWDAGGEQWAHASAAVITTPTGKISRYFHGVQFNPQSLKLSLLEASDGKVGTVIDSLIMYCFHFDPGQNKFVFYAWNIMRFGAGLMILVSGTWVAYFWSRHRKQLKGVPS